MHAEVRAARLAGSIALAGILYLLRTALVSFLMAIALASLLTPLVNRFTRRLGWSRGTTVLGMAVGLALLLGLLSYLIIPPLSTQIRILEAEAPRYARDLERTLAPNSDTASPLLTTLYRQVSSRIERALADALDHSAEILIDFGSHLQYLLVIPILVFYLVRDASLLQRRVHAVLPPAYREVAVILMRSSSRALRGFVSAQLALSAIAGALTTLGLLVLGMPKAVVLGAASGVMETVPYLGPLAAGAIAAVAALHGGTGLVVRVVVLYAAVRLLMDLVIGPRILGRAMHLHPLTVLFAMLVGGQLLGVAGFFVAPPLAAMAAPVVRWALARAERGGAGPCGAEAFERTIEGGVPARAPLT